MVSVSELSVNFVMSRKSVRYWYTLPKKGSGRLILSMVGLHGHKHRRRMRQNLTYPLVIYVEHGKPVHLLSDKRQVS